MQHKTDLNLREALPIYKYTLRNGLKIALVRKKKSPIISSNLTYRIGSKDETREIAGFAHLFEHLMFEGSKLVPKGEFDRICSMAGGTNNAYTTYDWTSYTMTMPANQLELALWLERDRMFNLDINEEALENQKNVVIEEMKQVMENQPYGRWRERIAELAYAEGSGYSWDVIGHKESIRGADLDLVRSFHDNYYYPGAACLTLVGDLDPERDMKLIEKYFESEPRTIRAPRANFTTEMARKGTRDSMKDTVPLDAVFVAFHADGFMSEETFVGDIISYIASSGRSSELYRKLVHEQKIASQVGAFLDKREGDSLLTFYAFASDQNGNCDQLYDRLMEAVLSLRDRTDEKTLEKTGNQLAFQIANELIYSSGIADLACNYAVFYDEPTKIYELQSKYSDVDLSDIKAYFDKNLRPGDAVRLDVVKD